MNFFNYLKARELSSVELVISDAHAGLAKAIRQCFKGASWQRCQVHFLKNILNQVPKKDSQGYKEQVKALFRLNNVEEARVVKKVLMDRFAKDKSTQKHARSWTRASKLPSSTRLSAKGTLVLKARTFWRVNEELRRREKVIRIFPNVDSATRLLGSLLMDIHESWISSSRTYLEN